MGGLWDVSVNPFGVMDVFTTLTEVVPLEAYMQFIVCQF